MGNDPGRGGSRSDEPPPLATVRQLHVDDADGSGVTATEEWYETERLTGHITGSAHSTAPVHRPAPAQQGAPVVLDWRHAAPATPPTARERLGRTLAERRSRRRSRESQDTDVLAARTRAIERATLEAASQVEQPPALDREDDDHALDAAVWSGPRIGLREPADPIARPKRRSPSGDERGGHSRLRRALIVIAVVLSVAAVSVVAIVAETGSTVTKPPRTRPIAAASGPSGADLSTTVATTMSSALQAFARARKVRPAHRTVRARRRARHPARGRPRHSSRRPAVSRHQSSPAVTTPTTTPSASGSASVSPVSTSSYSRSSSLPAYSAQPAASEPAPATTKRVPLPAGPIGPGGTVGNNCNPKCS